MYTTAEGSIMKAPTNRIFTPARIVALVLIAVLALGLTYLRFQPDATMVTVPAGAKAGDLILEPGTYETEKGSYKADIGTLVVPENRADPDSRLIALPVVRIKAKSDHPAEPIFRLEGGPGITNMEFDKASRFAEKHDVVLVGYRGVDGSVVLDAPEVESALARSADFLGEESFAAYADAFKAAAKRYRAEGIDLAGYTLTAQVDDLEAARAALGYDRINLVSESAGTRTAMIYSWRYPRSIYRSVMIGVNPPGNFMWDPKTTDELIARYSALYAKEPDAGKRSGDLAATMRQTVSDMPDRWLFLPLKKGNVRAASFFGMMESTTKAGPFSAPLVLDSWLSVAEGDSSGLWMTSLVTELLFPKMFAWGQWAAAGRIDAQAAREYFSSNGKNDDSNIGFAASSYLWAGGKLADAFPADPNEDEYRHLRTSQTQTLLISGELDFSTPPQMAATQLLPYLPNGHQVVLKGIAHTGSSWNDQTEAGSTLVNTFFDSGQVDDSLYEPAKVDFTPDTKFTTLAKYVLGIMVGVALLAVISLLWMALRVRKRGKFGGKASSVLRSLYPIVLGLGGWFLGALVALTALPRVPINDELLVALSVGLPVAFGIWLAWADRDWSAGAGATGFAATVGGALVGAWLGFNATTEFLAIATAIVGATLGANLPLILLDILRTDDPEVAGLGEHASPTIHVMPSGHGPQQGDSGRSTTRSGATAREV